MQFSLAGGLVCVGLVLLGFILRAPLTVPLFASLAFGSTAIINLPSLGGSSPLIYTLFAAALVGFVAMRRRFWSDLGRVFARHHTAYVIAALMAYVCVGAVLLPRFFAGQTSALVAVRKAGGSGGVAEVPLAPTGGNITQTGYFVLGVLTFYAVSVLLLRRERLKSLRFGYIVWASMHAVHGVIDFVAKTVGAGDVLLPIRTASYAMLTEVEQGGFARIVGGYSEASAYGAITLACAAFAVADWQVTRSHLMLSLAVTLLLLVLLSTSSTAYGALAVVAAVVGFSVLRSFLTDRLSKIDFVLGAAVLLAIVGTIAVYLHDSRIFDPLVTLFEVTIANKAESQSAIERSYWNGVSLQSALDTQLLGVGLGSSRSSSWVVAVIAQLGLIGSLLIVLLVCVLAGKIAKPIHGVAGREIVALHNGAQAAALCGLLTAAIASGTADPGLIFFISLATTLACRRYAGREVANVESSRRLMLQVPPSPPTPGHLWSTRGATP